MARKRRVPKPVCRWCKQAFDPSSDKPAAFCGCPTNEGMKGTYKYIDDKGHTVEKRYGVWPEEPGSD